MSTRRGSISLSSQYENPIIKFFDKLNTKKTVIENFEQFFDYDDLKKLKFVDDIKS